MKLLLHTCCGPCFLGSYSYVSSFEITNYFYNPNIQPKGEYSLRLENLKKAAAGRSKEVVDEEYDPKEHLDAISADKSFQARCADCYNLRLKKTALKAKERGFDAFSTTLLVSPYQQHEIIKKIGYDLADIYGINFFYQDYREKFRDGQESARKMDIYRQKYCGCLLSKEEAAAQLSK